MRSVLYATTAIVIAMSLPAAAQNDQQGQAGTQQQATQQGTQATAQAGAQGSLLGTQFAGRANVAFGDLDADQSGGVTLDEFGGEDMAGLGDQDRQRLQQEFAQFDLDQNQELNEQELGQLQVGVLGTGAAGQQGQQQTAQGQDQQQMQGQQDQQQAAQGQQQMQGQQDQQTAQGEQQPAAGQGEQANVTVITVPAEQGQQDTTQQAQGGTAGAQTGEVQVAEQCMNDIQAYGNELYESNPTAINAVGREFETLRDAALTFARLGDEEACQMVLAEMRDLYTTRTANFDVEAYRAGRTQSIGAAVPVTQFGSLMSLDELEDTDVIGLNGEDLGEIDNVIVNPEDGTIQYVLLSTGGWFDTDYVPVRFQDIRVTPEGDQLILPITEEALDQAPKVDIETAYAGIDAWSNDVNTWWDQNIAQQ